MDLLGEDDLLLNQDVAWAVLTLELNSAPKFEVACVAGMDGLRASSLKLSNEPRKLNLLPQVLVADGAFGGPSVRGTAICPWQASWLGNSLSHRPERWIVLQHRDENSTGYLKRVFGDCFRTPSDQAYMDRLLPKGAVIVRPSDFSNGHLIEALVGLLRRRGGRVVGWRLHASTQAEDGPDDFADLVIAPAPDSEQQPGEDAVPEVPEIGPQNWQLNSSGPVTLDGSFWRATDVRRYMRIGGVEDFPPLIDLVTGSYDPAAENPTCRTIIPGCCRVDNRLFACLRVEIALFRQDQIAGPDRQPRSPVEVSALLAPLESVQFFGPSLSESEQRLTTSLLGWDESGHFLSLRPPVNSIDWAVGQGGTEVDSEKGILAEFHSPVPPDDNHAGVYIKPRKDLKVVVRVASGGIPEVIGGPIWKRAELEQCDVSLNAATVSIICKPADTAATSQAGIEISEDCTRVTATSDLDVQASLNVKGTADVRGDEMRIHGNLKIASQ